MLFKDQLGFYLLPAVVRSYAPVGQTPVLRYCRELWIEDFPKDVVYLPF